MTIHLIDDHLLSREDADWLETQFFTQTALRAPDLEWGPIAPMPSGARRAMHATLGMLVVAVVGLIVFVIYSNVIMPSPVPLGTATPGLPPTAAETRAPNG